MHTLTQAGPGRACIQPELNQPSCEGPLVNLNGRAEEYIAADAGVFAGDTFSNMVRVRAREDSRKRGALAADRAPWSAARSQPTPGLVSRPDRILVFEPKAWQTQRAFVLDGGAEYANVMARCAPRAHTAPPDRKVLHSPRRMCASGP